MTQTQDNSDRKAAERILAELQAAIVLVQQGMHEVTDARARLDTALGMVDRADAKLTEARERLGALAGEVWEATR